MLKRTKRPSAARLLVEFLLSEEGMTTYVSGEPHLSLREGLVVPDAVKQYLPDVDRVKVVPVNWPALTLSEVRKAQNDFRRVLRVD
jgi:ABC-type Fe3+ transport system substrate-binding protein